MRRSTASRRRDWTLLIWTVLLGVAVFAGIAGLVFWKLQERDIPGDLNCSTKYGPKGHVVLLVDKTDPLTFTQGKAFAQILDDLATGKLVKEGELLSVFVLGEDFRATAEPLFEKCNPGDGTGKDAFKDNPKLWKDMHEKQYKQPLLALEAQMRAIQPAKASPILEMLQVVSLRFSKFNVSGPRRLIIVSDMLHNTPGFSFFTAVPNFAILRKDPAFARLRSKLDSVDVTIRMLLLNPKLQTTSLAKFWEEYFQEMGGTLQQIDPLPG